MPDRRSGCVHHREAEVRGNMQCRRGCAPCEAGRGASQARLGWPFLGCAGSCSAESLALAEHGRCKPFSLGESTEAQACIVSQAGPDALVQRRECHPCRDACAVDQAPASRSAWRCRHSRHGDQCLHSCASEQSPPRRCQQRGHRLLADSRDHRRQWGHGPRLEARTQAAGVPRLRVIGNASPVPGGGAGAVGHHLQA